MQINHIKEPTNGHHVYTKYYMTLYAVVWQTSTSSEKIIVQAYNSLLIPIIILRPI